MNESAPPPRRPQDEDDEDDEFRDDEDEQQGFELHSSGLQKVLWPMYILLAMAFMGTMSVPLLVMYTLGWQAWQFSSTK